MLTGYLKDTREFEETLLKNNMTLASTLYAPGQERLDRFKLNNMSFAGPVIMGIGGKLSKILSVWWKNFERYHSKNAQRQIGNEIVLEIRMTIYNKK